MPAHITVSGLSCSTPDGRRLFTDLDLSFEAGRTGLVGRNGVGKSTLLRIIGGSLKPRSGAVSVSGTVGVLHQTVQLGRDEIIADLFGVRQGLAVLMRAAAGEASAEDLSEADWTLETRLEAALASVKLDAEPHTPLASLSGGQRTRAALAALLFEEPNFLLLDEPTNNLDRDGRQAVIELLVGWRGGAIIVSHDREILENVDAIVELNSLRATRYGGAWSDYRARKALDLEAARRGLADAERHLKQLAEDAQTAAERKKRKDGAGRRKRAKGDAPKMLLDFKKGRSETTDSLNANLAERRRDAALEQAAAAREQIEILQPISMTLPSAGLAPGREVLRLEAVTAGYTPGLPIIQDMSLDITGPERIAVTGPNASGKTTLLALITGALQPWSGTVRVLTSFASLDQHVSLLDPRRSIRENYRRINPGCDENSCRAALARFMFRADTTMQLVGTLSGGEMLRAGLACVLGAAPPGLIILDEPTNHLDIDSIEALEAGLCAYDGAILAVSHDEAFLQAIGIERRMTLPLTATAA